MAIAKLGSMALDVNDLQRAKTFWQTVLGTEIASEDETYIFFKAAPGVSGLTLQKVPEGKSGKNRVHPDLEVEDLDEALDELINLGATVIRPIPEDGFRWAVLQDPEGNEFCISAD